ncbi:glucose-1-phosphate cytidylyltransferase [Alphaproteobacteria bacterium]|nr:glucose-1-phosphate cytidylyltransferase [Alphaproteobacteria bacterium]
MKVVILAGGLGTRLSEYTESIPKPLVKIGSMPIIWHIMKIYSQYGHNEFIIPLGYKGELIKDFFLNLKYFESDFTIDTSKNKIEVHKNKSENWKITFVDTGLDTMTGGRLLKLKKYIGNDKFFLTYGDGLANININNLLDFHLQNKKVMTVTAVRPVGRFGEIQISDNNNVKSFMEKLKVENRWINGGFFVVNSEFFEYLKDDKTILEHEPLQQLSLKGELIAYKHSGSWQCMDNKKDYDYLNNIWENEKQFWLLPNYADNKKGQDYLDNLFKNKKQSLSYSNI